MVSPARPRGVTATGPSTPRLKMPVFPDFLAPSIGTSAPTLTLSRRKLALQGCAVAGDPVDVVDVGDAPDLAYYLLDVLHTRGFESEPAQGRPVLDGIDPRGDDVDAGVRDRGRYILQQMHPVEGFDEQLDGFALGEGERGERRALVPGPFLFFLWLYLLDYATRHVLGRENAGTHGGEHVVGR